MKLLFVNGDRGLLAAHYGKFYFPDRNSNIKTEGVYDCEITVQKPNYGFVKGTKVTTPAICDSKDNVCRILREIRRLKNSEGNHVCNITTLKIEDNELFAIEHSDGTIEIGYYYDGETFGVVARYHMRLNRRVRDLYNQNKRKYADGWEDFRRKANIDSFDEIDDVNKIVSTVICKFRMCKLSDDKIESIKIYGNKIIYIKTKSKYFESNHICGYDAQVNNVFDLCDVTDNDLKGMPVYTIDKKDIQAYMRKNHISNRAAISSDGQISQIAISFMGDDLSVFAINGEKLLEEELTEENKNKVEDSFRELDAYRKREGKNISGRMISELGKLSDINILGLNF